MARKYAAIQIMRFAAASFVVIDHAISSVVQNWPDAARFYPIAWALGELGVILFFGISGFIMASTQYESFGSPHRALEFSVRRIIRIVPIYAVATTLQYLNRMHQGGAFTFQNYVKSLFFVPYMGDGGIVRPILGQGWTLNYEMFFYLIFAVSLCLTRPIGLLLGMGVFLMLACLQGGIPSSDVALNFYANSIMLYFVCGMLIGILKRWLEQSTPKLLIPMLGVLALMTLATALKVALSDAYFLMLGLIVVSICVYVGASSAPVQATRTQVALERFGDASYSTYLFHGSLLGGMKFLSNRVGSHDYIGAIAYILLSILVANLGGLIIFMWVEGPLTRLLNRRERAVLSVPHGR